MGNAFGFGLHSLSSRERAGVRASPNPTSLPPPVLAGLEKIGGDGLKNLDVRRLQSRLVSRFSGSFSFFKEPRSGPDCGSPFGVRITSLREVSEPPLRELLVTFFWRSKRKVSCRRATPGSHVKAKMRYKFSSCLRRNLLRYSPLKRRVNLNFIYKSSHPLHYERLLSHHAH